MVARDLREHDMPGKVLFSVIAGLVPVVWCGGLALYFYRINHAVGGLASGELIPTIAGLGAVGLLFTIPFLVKLTRLATGTKSKAAALRDNDPVGVRGASDFDADAVIARYLERKAAGEVTYEITDDPPRPVFGRRV